MKKLTGHRVNGETLPVECSSAHSGATVFDHANTAGMRR
jgi:hypothetical protein